MPQGIVMAGQDGPLARDPDQPIFIYLVYHTFLVNGIDSAKSIQKNAVQVVYHYKV